jgi:hypothetical protein
LNFKPLDDIINALDWYVAYSIILSFTFAQLDHACRVGLKSAHHWVKFWIFYTVLLKKIEFLRFFYKFSVKIV